MLVDDTANCSPYPRRVLCVVPRVPLASLHRTEYFGRAARARGVVLVLFHVCDTASGPQVARSKYNTERHHQQQRSHTKKRENVRFQNESSELIGSRLRPDKLFDSMFHALPSTIFELLDRCSQKIRPTPYTQVA